jgi:hypothetical protein
MEILAREAVGGLKDRFAGTLPQPPRVVGVRADGERRVLIAFRR